jgi:hypothetical protein
MRAGRAQLAILGLLGLLAACSDKTETGYDPHKLDMSDSQRRALYASPFSPEAKSTDHEKMDPMESHAPGSPGM